MLYNQKIRENFLELICIANRKFNKILNLDVVKITTTQRVFKTFPLFSPAFKNTTETLQ